MMQARSQCLGCDYSCGGDLAAPSHIWPAVKSWKLAAFQKAAHSSPWDRELQKQLCLCFNTLWGLFLSKTETHRHCQTSYFSRKDLSPPTEGDFIAIKCRQDSCGGCAAPEHSPSYFSPLRAKPAQATWFNSHLVKHRLPPNHAPTVLQSYLLSYHIRCFFCQFCK